jgi:hypothetical protein
LALGLDEQNIFGADIPQLGVHVGTDTAPDTVGQGDGQHTDEHSAYGQCRTQFGADEVRLGNGENVDKFHG